jgi:hypothetical protein
MRGMQFAWPSPDPIREIERKEAEQKAGLARRTRAQPVECDAGTGH